MGATTRDLYNRRLAAEMEADAAGSRQQGASTEAGATKHRCRRDDTPCQGQKNEQKQLHMLAGDGRLDDILASLGTEKLPESYTSTLYLAFVTAFWAPERGFSLDYRLQQVQDSLSALYYVNYGGTPPAPWRIDLAMDLMARLHNRGLLKIKCSAQGYMVCHDRRVTGCKFKQALISNYMTPLDFRGLRASTSRSSCPRAASWPPREGSHTRSRASPTRAAGRPAER